MQDNRIVTFVGTGGVGKTSLSIATALLAAKSGKRVAAVTIDPSRRLTSLLGLSSAEKSMMTLQSPNFTGSLDIYHIDSKDIFLKFVKKHLSPSAFEKLERNGIFQQISKNLRETHNFASLYEMVEICSSEDYDFYVLDTPPCHQVLDFFESPGRLQKFFAYKEADKNSWLGWVQDKGVAVAENFMKKLVGKEFVKEMDLFFSSIRDLRKDIHRVASDFENLLQNSSSKILMVFPPALDKLSEASHLVKSLQEQNYIINDFVMNRSYIEGLDQSEELGLAQDSREYELYNYFKGLQESRQKMLIELKAKLNKESARFSLVPEIEQTIESVEDIITFGEKVEESWKSLSF